MKDFVAAHGPAIHELYMQMVSGSLTESERAEAWSAYERLGGEFVHQADGWMPEALRAPVWRHIATTGGSEPINRLPDDCNEAVQVLGIEEHAPAWDGAPVPHVVLRVDLLSAAEQDVSDVLRFLKQLRGFEARRGTKAAKEFRAVLASRAMARRVLSDQRPLCIEPPKWVDTKTGWMRYAERGRIESYVIESVCLLYSAELSPYAQISDETVKAALRRHWNKNGSDAGGSLEELFGFRLEVPAYARVEGAVTAEPWISSTCRNVIAPWW